MRDLYKTLQKASSHIVRSAIRDGTYQAHTAGLCPGYLQANVIILPEVYALDFMRFCQRNPKPCPVIGVSDTGNPQMFTLGRDLDIRSDVPSYNIYQHGRLDRTVDNIHDLWRDDFVAFALGCSFTFEHALQAAGVPQWHIDNDKTVPMFRSNQETRPCGPFSGPMVVSMRAIRKAHVKLVEDICAKFPFAHGAPVHWGEPEKIGIKDLNHPDWGEAAPMDKGQVPVFWACGVTPQVSIEKAGIPFCITHKPGHMLITEVADDAEIPVM